MRNRIIPLLFALALTVSLLSAQVAAAANEETAEIKIGSVCAANQKQITVPVSITNNPGFAGFTFQIRYDTAKLKLTDIRSGEVIGSGNMYANPEANTVFWYDTENVYQTGLLLELQFAVTGIPDGPILVSLELQNDEITNFCNEKFLPVPLSVSSGLIAPSEVSIVSPVIQNNTVRFSIYKAPGYENTDLSEYRALVVFYKNSQMKVCRFASVTLSGEAYAALPEDTEFDAVKIMLLSASWKPVCSSCEL